MIRFSHPLLAATASLTLIAGAAALPSQAFAQDNAISQNPDQAKVFDAAFFEAFSPSNALEMVERLPGFQLDGGDDKRGLGQGGANVLINGERVTGKSDIGGQLNRISASNVVRIEVLDGASLRIPGLSGQVANIITENTGISGTWRWAPQFRKRQQANLGHFHLTVSGETGDLSYTGELRAESRKNGHWGPETVTAADGTLYEIRDENARYYSEAPGAVLDLAWKPKPDHVGNLNLEYNQFNFNGSEISDRRAITERGETIQTQFSNAEDEWNAKIGADYEFPFLSGKLKTIGYYRAEHSPTVSRFDVFEENGTQSSGSRFFQVADEGEAIARTEYSWAPSEGRDWQLGLEGAYNSLDIEQSLFVSDGGEFIDQNLESDTKVEEKRAEGTLTHSRKLSPKWDVQASVGVEYSQIMQTGDLVPDEDGEVVRDFVRPKGFVAATYKPQDNFSIRTRIEREVGQLSFFDFISSVDIRDQLGNDENLNLVPSQSWLGSVEFDRKFAQGSTVKVKFYGSLISDLVSQIPTENGGESIGNIDGQAYRYGIDTNITLKGEQWGLKGVQLDLEADWRDSSVDDPFTEIARRLNDDKETYLSVTFRHDIVDTDWAYGFFIDEFVNAPAFRRSTINDFHFDGPWGTAFIEHKDVFGMKIKFELLNLFDASDNFNRQRFTGRRGDEGTVLNFTEDNSRKFDRFVNIELSGTF